jgi:sialic acid synthase SpsE
LEIKTKNFLISKSQPTYFIADIAANHDGSLNRAKELIELAAKSGASAAKFQNFRAEKIVSDYGFKELGKKIAHQEMWKKSIFQVYKDAEVPLEWTEELSATCDRFEIDYFTATYDIESIDFLSNFMDMIKIGSGDINYLDIINKIIEQKKSIFLATGASTIDEVVRTVDYILDSKTPLVLMQCNTNYSGQNENNYFLNLNVLDQFNNIYPKLILGLSDHSNGHLSVISAVSKGAKVIEKHFTDDKTRIGPDHGFSLSASEWARMVSDVREVEIMLGDGNKKVEENEVDSRIVQRRTMRFTQNLQAGHVITKSDISVLRPAPKGSEDPYTIDEFIGKKLVKNVKENDILTKKVI